MHARPDAHMWANHNGWYACADGSQNIPNTLPSNIGPSQPQHSDITTSATYVGVTYSSSVATRAHAIPD